MPIAKFQLPDGRVGRFEVPEGTSPEQAMQLISTNLSSLLPKPAPEERPSLGGAMGETLPEAIQNVAVPKKRSVLEGMNLGVPPVDYELNRQAMLNNGSAESVMYEPGRQRQAVEDEITMGKAKQEAKRNLLRQQAAEENYTPLTTAQDIGASLGKGISGGIAEPLVGLWDLMSFGAAGRALEGLGYNPQKVNSFFDGMKSATSRNQEQNVAEAEGFVGTIQALGVNPAALVNSIAESVPGIVATGYGGGKIARSVIDRFAKEAAAKGLVRTEAQDFIRNSAIATLSASGAEGLQTAGSVAEAGRQSGEGFTTYAPAAIGAGVTTAAISGIVNKFAAAHGVGDLQTHIAANVAGLAGSGIGKGLKGTAFLRELLTEGTKEGVFEEMPQSATEQIFNNIATGKPWDQGVDKAAAQGLVLGASMAGIHVGASKSSEEAAKLYQQSEFGKNRLVAKAIQQNIEERNFNPTVIDQAARMALSPENAQLRMPPRPRVEQQAVEQPPVEEAVPAVEKPKVQAAPKVEETTPQAEPPIEELTPQVTPKVEEPVDENAPSQDQEEMMRELGLIPKKENKVELVPPQTNQVETKVSNPVDVMIGLQDVAFNNKLPQSEEIKTLLMDSGLIDGAGKKPNITPKGQKLLDVLNPTGIGARSITTQEAADIVRQYTVPARAPKIEEAKVAEPKPATTPVVEPTPAVETPQAPKVKLHNRDIPITLNKVDANRGDQLVEVNTKPFEERFKQDESMYVGPKGTANAIKGRYPRFVEFSKTAPSIEAPNVAVNENGQVVFGNGRHRYAYMRDQGLSKIPMSMDAESIANAKKFGYIGEQAKEKPSKTMIAKGFNKTSFVPDEADQKAIDIYKSIKAKNPNADVDELIKNPNDHSPVEEKPNYKNIKIGDLIYEKGNPDPYIAISVGENARKIPTVDLIDKNTGERRGSIEIDNISKEPIDHDYHFDFGQGKIDVDVSKWIHENEYEIELIGPGVNESGYFHLLDFSIKSKPGSKEFNDTIEEIAKANSKVSKIIKPLTTQQKNKKFRELQAKLRNPNLTEEEEAALQKEVDELNKPESKKTKVEEKPKVKEKPVEKAEEEKPAAVSDDQVKGHLENFASGNFGVPGNIAGSGGAEGRAIAERANKERQESYDVAAKQFLEGPLTTKPPTKKQATLNTEKVTDVEPQVVTKTIGKTVSDFEGSRQALLTYVAPKSDIRYYLNGTHIDEKNKEVVATDGHRLAIVKVAPENLPEKNIKDATVLTRDGKWIDGKYPDYRKVMPDKHGEKVSADMTKVGDYARGVVKAGKYVGGLVSVPITIGDETLGFDASYVVGMADLFRKLGYNKVDVSFAKPNRGQELIYATSPDGKVQQVIMPIKKADKTFKPLLLGGPEKKAVPKPEVRKPEPQVAKNTPAVKDPEQALKIYEKQKRAYEDGELNEKEFLAARKAYNKVMDDFEKQVDTQLIEGEDYNVIDGTDLIREIGHEKQLLMIADASTNLTQAEEGVLETEYGAKVGSDEFLERLHADVIDFITYGAKAIKNKIRPIIQKISNSLLSVAVAFNMNFVSPPVNIVVPTYETVVTEVTEAPPEEAARDMSAQARRAYEVLYPSLKDELIKSNKLFLITDKPTAMQFIFNPDGTLLMKNKVLLAKGIGDFEKGNNNIDANKITPAGVRTLVKRFHTTSTEGYDFDTVFGTMGVDEKTGGQYFSTVYHSVYTHLNDAQKRLEALKEPGAANSRYSFGCINVDKVTFGKLVKEHGDQMDGATLFVVPDNDKNVMNFINGQATEAKDIVRRKVEPTLKEERVPVREASKTEGQKLAGREQEFGLGYPVMMTSEERKEMIGNYAKLRAMIARIYRKAKVGKFGLGEQMTVTSLEELAADYKKAIRSTQLPRTAPGKFFARASEAYAAGDITKDVFDVVVDAYRKFPELIDGLALSVLKRPEGSASSGQFSSFGNLVTLYKETEGVDDPEVIRHELTHSLEKMMTPQAQENLFDAWKKDFKKAQQKYTSTAEKTFFESVIKFFNDPTPLMHQAMMEAYQETGNIDLYQYMTPSEYWAMNAEKLMERRLGSGWDKFVNAIARLFEGLKNILGFNNKYAVHKVFKQVMAGSKERKNDTLLTTATGTNYRLNMPSQRYNYKGQPAPAASFDSPTDTKMDDILRHIQDKHVDTKRLVQELEKSGKKISEEWNPYLKEELYHGRTADQIKTFLDDELIPLVKEMGEHKVTLADFDEYLYMRHAEERNEQIASINPTYSDVDLTFGSGKSTSAAKDYLKNLPTDKRKIFESLAKKVDGIIKGTQDVLVDGGLETADTIHDWNKTYAHYVPLQRSEEELDFVHHGSGLGQGMSTKGGASKRAFGSSKNVVDIFSNIALQRERAIIRSEKAVVGKALYGLALQNPNPDFWLAVNPDAIKNKKKLFEELTALGLSPSVAANIIQEPKVATIDPLTGLVRYQVNSALRNSENVFPVRINGKDRYVFFNNKDVRAKNIVKAMKNLDSEQLGYVFGMTGDMTRWIAAVNTQYNPVFGAWNFLRDVGGANFNLSTTPIADKKWEVNKNVFPALFAIGADLRGNRKGIKGNEEMQKWHRSFLGAGGATGYSEQFSRGRSKINGEKLETVVEKELGKLNRGNVAKVSHYVFDWLSDYNDAMENAVRLSAFKVYLEDNMSEAEINSLLNGGNITLGMQRHIDKAASIAKNLTVNFNRKGSASATYQSLFAFFNASVQGTARLAETLKGPAGRKIMAGGFALGAIQAIALAMAGYDDDEPPEYLKNKNLIIPLGDTYLIAPLPLGLNIFPGIGRIATEYVLGKMGFITGAKGGASKVGDVLALALDTFNPLGGGSLSQMMTPTIADPIIALSSNKDAFGRPISKEDMSSHPTPGYLRSRENANVIAQGISEFLNYASGGNEDVKGGFSPTADQISYFAGQYTGGVGRELMKGVDLGSSLFTGEPLPSYRVPIVGKMYGETNSPAAIQDKFYKNVVIMSEHEDSLKGRLKRHEDRQEYMQEHPEARLWKMANSIENQVSALNKQRKILIERGAPDERIEMNRERKTRIMEKFNEKVKELQAD